MFRKEKMEKINEVWIIDIAGKTIPLKTVSVFVQTVLWIALCFFTYTIGAHDQAEYFKYATYISELGGYDATNHQWVKCYPVQEGSVVQFECEDREKPNSEEFFFTLNETT